MKKKYMLLYLLLALNIIAASSLVAAKTYSSKVIKVISQGGEITMPIAISFLAAAIATSLSCISAAIALRAVSTAGFAASAERPELKVYMLILGGLAEGIAIYGLLTAIMILGKIKV